MQRLLEKEKPWESRSSWQVLLWRPLQMKKVVIQETRKRRQGTVTITDIRRGRWPGPRAHIGVSRERRWKSELVGAAVRPTGPPWACPHGAGGKGEEAGHGPNRRHQVAATVGHCARPRVPWESRGRKPGPWALPEMLVFDVFDPILWIWVVPEVTSCQLIASVLLLLLWFGPGSAECCAAALFALRLARVSSLSLIRLRSLTSCPTPGTGSTISWNRCGLSVNIDNYTLFTCFVIVLSWCCFCWILSFSVWKGIQENRMVGVAWVLELSALMMTLCQRLATDFFSSFFT